MKVRDFSGIIINVGIDVHLKTWIVAIFIENTFYTSFRQEACPEILYNYLSKNFPNGIIRTVYEAGYFGFVAHRELHNLGINNIVVNPADVPTTAKEKSTKTDKIDAKKLAKGLVNMDLRENYVPTAKQEADRELVRLRIAHSRKGLTRIKQQIKGILIRKGIKYYELIEGNNSTWSSRYIKALEELQLGEPSDQLVISKLIRKLKYTITEQKELDREIVKLSQTEPHNSLVTRLRTIPGIGLLTAMMLSTELIDMKRFKSLDHLCSYMGIVPNLEQSGESSIVKGLTKRTNHDARRILIQAAWQASIRNPDLAGRYHKWKKENGGNGQKAIIKVAKRLLSISRAIWMKETIYKID